MTPATLAAPPPQLTAAPTALTTSELARRGDIRRTAETFEAQFLSIMLQQMFQGVETEAPFGGGQGEQMFRSFMTEAMGRQMAAAGGIGLADTVQREMLKMQGLD